MMLFVAFVATFNLCVGYVLGVYFGVLPGLPRRPAVGPMAELYEAPERPAPQPAPDPDPFPPVNVSSWPVNAPAQPDTAAVTQDILTGLAAFRQKLAQVNDQLHQVDGSRESIDHCAGELRQANDQYMSDADRALAQLDEAPTPDATHRELKATLVDQAQQVQHVNTTLDELMANPDTELVHRRLLETTGELDERAVVVEQKAKASEIPQAAAVLQPAVPVPLPPPDPEPATITVEMERLLEMASRQLEGIDMNRPLQMAAVKFDESLPGENQDPDVSQGLLQLVESVLGDGQRAAVGNESAIVMLLKDDDQVAAIQRCERLRQLVAASTFTSGGNTHRITATCSIVTAAPGMPVEQVITRLHESLAEARRYGPNRCLHHDGKFPAPVVPHTMDVVGMTVAV